MKKITLLFTFLIAFALSCNAQWAPTNGPQGGYVSCFAQIGTNTFAGTYGGGVFVSSNSGSSWTAINNGLTHPWIGALAISGTNLFAGTHGGGVFLSTNNGANWTAVNTGLTNTEISSLAAIGSNIFAGTSSGVFLSTNNGTSWTAVNNGLTNTNITCLNVNNSNLYAGTGGSGVFLSTNNGSSWAPINTGMTTSYINSIASGGSNILAATWGAGVYRSQNDGASWTQVNSGLTNQDAMTIYKYNSDLYLGTKNGGAYYSNNNGSSWTHLNNGITSNVVRAIIANGANVFAGTSDGIFYSSSYGTSWTAVNNGLYNKLTQALYQNGTKLFAGTYGGMYASSDNGYSWNQSGLSYTSVQAITAIGVNLFAGTAEGVWRSNDNGNNWSQGNTVIRWEFTNALAVSGSNLFAGTNNGAYLSTDNGTSWTQVNNGLTNTFVGALAVSGSNIFAGTGNGVFLSTNNGSSWTSVSSGLTNTEIHALILIGTNLFAGTSDGVFLSTNNGTNWTQIKSGDYIASLAYHGTDLYAGGWQKLFISKNNGTTWTQCNGGLSGKIYMVNALYSNGTDLFSGTQGDGVYKLIPTINDGDVWSQQNTQMPGSYIVANQVCVVDSNVVWLNGISLINPRNFAQAMSRTNDGGATWTSGNYSGLGSNVLPSVLSAVSYNIGFCCAYDTVTSAPYFYKTVDGGSNWTVVPGIFNNPSSSWPDGVKFWDHGKGFCYGDPVNNHFEIYYTSDSGVTWTQVADANNPLILSGEYGFTNPKFASIVSGGIGYFATNKGRIYKTTDYGVTWATTPTAPFAENIGIISASSANYILVSSHTYSKTLYTTNGGSTWDTVRPLGNFYNYDLCHVPNTNKMFVGTSPWSGWRGLNYSNDGGLSWSEFEDPTYVQPGSNTPFFGVGFYNTPLTAVASANATTICSGSPTQLNVTSAGGNTCGWVGNSTSPYTYNSILKIKHTPTYTYSWTSSPAGFASTLKNPTINPTANTTYFVTVSDGVNTTTSSILISILSPTVQATSFTVSAVTNSSMTVGWTRGSGDSVLVVAKQGSPVSTNPTGGTIYTPNVSFGSGSEIGSGNYVVYNGSGTSVNITNLMPGITYYFAVYEYTAGTTCYMIPPLTGSATTSGSYLCTSLNYLATKAQSIPGSYVDLGTNGNVIVTADFDDANSAAQNIGFPFEYNCQLFTHFVLNTNGFIKLGSTPPSTATLFFDGAQNADNGIFNSTNPADINLVAAFNHDLMAGTGTPEYRVYTSGVAPNRICTIQFKNVRDKTTSPAQQYDNMQFQIKLYETTNIIEFVYGDWTPSLNASAFKTSACGLKGSSNADNELLVVNKGSATSWDGVTFTNANYSTTATLNFGNPIARPKPDAGRTFRFIPKYDNDLAVGEIYSMGDASLYYSNPQPVSVNIMNNGYYSTLATSVTLSVTGANTFTDTKPVPALLPGENTIVTFSDFTASANGSTLVTISLPNDDYNADNVKTWTQNTNDYICNYSSSAIGTTGFGFHLTSDPTQSASGSFEVKYHVNGSANVNSVTAFIYNYSSNVGNTICGIVLNSSGSIIAQSDNYVIQAGDLGAWHTFTINTPPTITDDYFFAGMAVTAGSTVYYPIGLQNENPSRSGTYYSSAIDGSGLTEKDPSSFPYRYMIGAILAPLPPVAGTAYNNSLICAGYTTSMYLAGYTGFIQWQQSPDGTSNWTNVTGGTGTTTANYTTAALATTTYFRAQVSEPTYSDVYSNVITVTVTPVPVIPAQTASVCSSGTFTVTPADNPPITIAPVGTTYNWSVPTVTGGLIGGAAASGQASIFGTLTNPTNIPQTATYTVTPVGPTCTGADFILTVTVNPKPVIANKSTTICGGASFTVSPVNGTDIVPSGTTYSWSAPTVTGGLTGGAAGNNQTSISGTLTNPTNTPQTATYTVTPSTSIPCPGASFTVTVTVNPTPVIPSLMGSICSGEIFTFSPANAPPSIIIPSGTNYSWAAPSVTGGITGGISSFNQASFSATLINPTNTPQTATYTITPATTVPCLGSSFTLTITVNPKPTIPAQTVSVCSGSTFTVSPSNNPPGTIVPLGTSYSWSAPTVSGGLTGGASGSGQTSISGTLINPTNIPQTATYTVTPTTSIPCPGNSFTITVTVNPTPVVPSQTATICSGSTFTISPANAPPSTIIPSGTTYSWSAPTVTGGITGGTAGSGQTLISGTLTNPTNTVQTATYTVTPTTTIPCPGTSFTVTVTVNPTPVVPAQTATICSGGTFAVAPTNNPPGTITPAGTTYSWSVPTVTGGITGGAAGSGQTLISGTLTNPTNTPQTATYTVTPTTTIPCPGTSFTVTVTVNPTPSVHAQSAIICSGGTFTVTPANNPPGTIVPLGITYSWSAPTVTGGLTGGAAGSGQSSISGTLINPTNIPQTATYTVTPTTSIPCPGNSFTITVTVNPTPVVPSQTATICSGSTFTISPANAPPSTIIPSGTTYSWSAPTVTGGITGGTAGSGQTLISGTLTNPTNTVQTATYTVTPTTTIPCPGTSFTVTVTVNPTPVVPAQTATICSGGTFTVTPANNPPGTIVPSGTAYSWSTPTVTGGMTGGTAGSGQSSISGTLTNPTNTPQTATYTVTPTTSIPCPGNSFTVTVTVNPTPNVLTASPTTICSGTATNIALNSNVNGASFSWTIGAITGGITGASASSGTTIEQTLTNTGNTAGSVTYIVTPSANSCSGVATNIVVTVNPTPDVLTTSPTTICSGSATNIALNSNVSGTTFTWTIGAITGGITGASASGGSSITQTLTNPSSSTGSVTYVVTPSANTCPGVTTNIVVTVNPAPAISNMTTEVCNGAGFTISPVDITNGIVPAGTTYSWNAPTVSGGMTGGTAGSGQSSISGTLTNPTNTPQTATYTVTTTTSIPCPGNSFTVTVTVNPTPNVLTASPTTICSGTATNIALNSNVSGASFSWTVGTITGGITGASSSGGTAITQTLLNPGITDGSVTYIVTPTANTCTGSPTNIVVTVNPTPNVSTASSTVICSGATTNIALTSNFVGSTFSWTIGTITGGITGASASNGLTIAQALNNPNATAGSVTYIVTPSANTCPGVPSNIVVTVDPTPVISAMSADVCSGSTFTVLPVNGVNGIVPSGNTYSWSAPTVSGGLTGGVSGSGQTSISGTLINPTNIPQTATYTVTPTTSIPCPGNSFTITVTVNPTPVVPSQTATICSGSTFTITPANAPPSTIIPSGTTYSWSAPTVTGGITGGTAGSGQTLISGTLTNPTNTVQTATYTVTPTTTIPCPGTSFTVTVTVNPTPVVPAQTATICSGGTFTVAPANNPPGTIVPSGTAYSWSTPTVTGGMTGGTAGSGQSSISGTLTNPTNTPQTATYTVTPTTSIPCPGNSFIVTVTVNPTPNVLTASPTTICSGTATNIALNSNVSGASFSWTIGTITGGITGASASSGTTIEQTLTNPGNTAGSVTYIVTPSANSCSGVATNIVVTVNPTPDVLTTSPTTICSGSATNIALNSNVSGTTFTWTIGAITGGITGASDSGGPSITQTLTNPSSSIGSVTYVVTPSANNCLGVTTNNVVTVNPAPAISNMTTEVCNGAGFTISPVDITNGIVPAGTTYSWNAPTVSGGITGGTTGSGQNSISGMLTNTTNSPQTATYTVTPSTAVPCVGTSFTITVTVNPTPNVSTASPTTICSGTATNIALNSNVSGASFSWTIGTITGGITGASASSGTTIEQTLTNPGNTAGSVTYIVTPSANSCSGVATNIVVTVNPTPDVLTTSPTTICSGSATNIALNSNVSGTTFTWTIGAITGGITGASASSGPSITQTLTNPSSSIGSVTYVVTPSANNCLGVTTNIVVMVNPAPEISNMTTEVCNGAGFTISPVDITNGIVPAGTTYSWNAPTVSGGITGGTTGSGQNSISGMLTNTTNSPQTATYTVTPSTAVPCVGNSFTVTVTVNPTPYVNTTSPTTICSGTATNIALNSNVSGASFSWTIGTITGGITGASASGGLAIAQTLTNSGTTAGTVEYIVTPSANGCSGIPTIILVTINPSYSYTVNQSICNGNSYLWHGNNYTSTGEYNAIYASVSGCDSVYTLILTVNTVDIGVTLSNFGVTISADSAADAYQWVDCDNNFAPLATEINQSFTATANGHYAVIITQGSCSDTSACTEISSVGIAPFANTMIIELYPNPVSDVLTIEIKGNTIVTNFEILNLIGQVVFKGTMLEKTTIRTTDFATGVYLIKIKNGKYFEYRKIVKQ